MPKLLQVFAMGMFISFIGTLPLGTLNIAAMQISISDGFQPAILFALGALTAEVIYVRISLVAMSWVAKQKKLIRALEWITVLIVSALAASSFYAALHPEVDKNIILSSTLHRYLLGFFMSALNPVQIPFWFGWSTVLFTKGVLSPKAGHFNVYIIGIGLGTLCGNMVFIFGGKLVADSINANQSVLNWVIGGIFLITAIIQIVRIIVKKDVQNQLEHPEEITREKEKQLEDLENS
jgi:threonine/homoserine/homoserine lactone efflux protein